MPDHTALLRSFVKQFKDRTPQHQKLHEILEYSMANIDATIHSVAVESREENWSCAHPLGASQPTLH